MLLLDSPKIDIDKLVVYNAIPKHDLDYLLEICNKNDLREHLLKIGSGSYGCVYRFKNYAIKYTYDTYSEDVRNMAMLQGSNCFPLLYFTISDTILVMELIDGKTVGRLEYKDNEIEYNENFEKDFKNGIKFAINKGFEPKDLHDGNVMVRKDGSPVIVDVGHFRLKGDRGYEGGVNDKDKFIKADYKINNTINEYNRCLKLKEEEPKKAVEIKASFINIGHDPRDAFMLEDIAKRAEIKKISFVKPGIFIEEIQMNVMRLNLELNKVPISKMREAMQAFNFQPIGLGRPFGLNEMVAPPKDAVAQFIEAKKMKEPNQFLEKKLGLPKNKKNLVKPK